MPFITSHKSVMAENNNHEICARLLFMAVKWAKNLTFIIEWVPKKSVLSSKTTSFGTANPG